MNFQPQMVDKTPPNENARSEKLVPGWFDCDVLGEVNGWVSGACLVAQSSCYMMQSEQWTPQGFSTGRECPTLGHVNIHTQSAQHPCGQVFPTPTLQRRTWDLRRAGPGSRWLGPAGIWCRHSGTQLAQVWLLEAEAEMDSPTSDWPRGAPGDTGGSGGWEQGMGRKASRVQPCRLSLQLWGTRGVCPAPFAPPPCPVLCFGPRFGVRTVGAQIPGTSGENPAEKAAGERKPFSATPAAVWGWAPLTWQGVPGAGQGAPGVAIRALPLNRVQKCQPPHQVQAWSVQFLRAACFWGFPWAHAS